MKRVVVGRRDIRKLHTLKAECSEVAKGQNRAEQNRAEQ